jgi:O-antigen/teichoic acid export membrane protein
MVLSGDWLLRGLEKTATAGGGLASGGLVVLLGSAVLLATTTNSLRIALALFVAGEVVAASIAWLMVIRKVKPRFGLRGARALLRRALPLAISVIVLYAYFSNLDTIAVSLYWGSTAAGYYSASYRLFIMMTLVATYASYVALPPLVRAAEHGTDEGNVLVRALPFLAGYGLACCTLIMIGGGYLLHYLYGSRFVSATDTFIVLSAAVPWYCVGYPTGYGLIAVRRDTAFLRGASVAAIVIVMLDAALIPTLGIVGAGIGTLASIAAATLVWMRGQRPWTGRIWAVMISLCLSTVSMSLFVGGVGPGWLYISASGLITVIMFVIALPADARPAVLVRARGERRHPRIAQPASGSGIESEAEPAQVIGSLDGSA